MTKGAPTDRLTLDEWVDTIEAAVGRRVGTKEQARDFAISMRSELARALPRGARLQTMRKDVIRLHELTNAALRSHRALASEVNNGSLLARQLDSQAQFRVRKQMPELDGDLVEAVELYHRALLSLAEEAMPSGRTRRGPPNTMAVTITRTIAVQYQAHFGRPPGRGNRDQGKSLIPFHAICNAVEDLLYKAGHKDERGEKWILLSDVARAEGIRLARGGSNSRKK